MKSEILTIFSVITVLVTIYILITKKVYPSRKKNVFYSKKRGNYPSRTFRNVISFVCLVLLIKYVNNNLIAVPLGLMLIFALIFIDLYFVSPKMLIIDNQKIRCPLHWSFNIEDLKNWHFDNKEKTITFINKYNKVFRFSIKDRDIDNVCLLLDNKVRNSS